ncbi:hypothetical protein ACF07Y_44795 [Streptomyces sp. NPDC016566]|uniref:hypothetical protein n=1 Tax=Streptomyces sp. NPDC016566 TaxID=3364967 RepID=UPI0036FA0C53
MLIREDEHLVTGDEHQGMVKHVDRTWIEPQFVQKDCPFGRHWLTLQPHADRMGHPGFAGAADLGLNLSHRAGQTEQHSTPTAPISAESRSVNGTGERATEPRRTRFDNVHKWSATLAAVAALAFSVYNFTELQKKPRIDVTLPHLFRTGPRDNGIAFEIQPTVSTRFKTQDVEVIRDARLQLNPVGSISSTKKPIFYWRETGKYEYDPTSDHINYQWASDPAPFVVSQDQPQQPTLNFWADNWTFQSGQYRASQARLLPHHSPADPVPVLADVSTLQV